MHTIIKQTELNSSNHHARHARGFVTVRGKSRSDLIVLVNQIRTLKYETLTKSESLSSLSLNLRRLIKDAAMYPVYWIDGNQDQSLYLPFRDLSTRRFHILRYHNEEDDQPVQDDGYILPQSIPIICVIENFNKLTLEDQQQYLSLQRQEEFDYWPRHYLHADSIIILSLDKDVDLPSFSYKHRVLEIIDEG